MNTDSNNLGCWRKYIQAQYPLSMTNALHKIQVRFFGVSINSASYLQNSHFITKETWVPNCKRYIFLCKIIRYIVLESTHNLFRIVIFLFWQHASISIVRIRGFTLGICLLTWLLVENALAGNTVFITYVFYLLVGISADYITISCEL